MFIFFSDLCDFSDFYQITRFHSSEFQINIFREKNFDDRFSILLFFDDNYFI